MRPEGPGDSPLVLAAHGRGGADGVVARVDGGGALQQRDGLGGTAVVAERAEQGVPPIRLWLLVTGSSTRSLPVLPATIVFVTVVVPLILSMPSVLPLRVLFVTVTVPPPMLMPEPAVAADGAVRQCEAALIVDAIVIAIPVLYRHIADARGHAGVHVEYRYAIATSNREGARPRPLSVMFAPTTSGPFAAARGMVAPTPPLKATVSVPLLA